MKVSDYSTYYSIKIFKSKDSSIIKKENTRLTEFLKIKNIEEKTKISISNGNYILSVGRFKNWNSVISLYKYLKEFYLSSNKFEIVADVDGVAILPS